MRHGGSQKMSAANTVSSGALPFGLLQGSNSSYSPSEIHTGRNVLRKDRIDPPSPSQ